MDFDDAPMIMLFYMGIYIITMPIFGLVLWISIIFARK